MHPILMKIGPFSIFSYGLLVATGFAAAVFVIYRRAPQFGIDKSKVVDIFILILLGGVFGARLLYVLLNLDYYTSNPLEILNLSKGGLVWYGAFLSGLAVAVFYMKKNNMNFWNTSDLAGPYIALAQSIGRIGCFLNGCCFGAVAPGDNPLGIVFPGTRDLRLPVQVYSSLALLLIFVILRTWQDHRHFRGEIFTGYLMLYSVKRFFMEFFRGDNPKAALDLTISQLMSVLIFLAAAAAFIYKASKWRKSISVSK